MRGQWLTRHFSNRTLGERPADANPLAQHICGTCRMHQSGRSEIVSQAVRIDDFGALARMRVSRQSISRSPRPLAWHESAGRAGSSAHRHLRSRSWGSDQALADAGELRSREDYLRGGSRGREPRFAGAVHRPRRHKMSMRLSSCSPRAARARRPSWNAVRSPTRRGLLPLPSRSGGIKLARADVRGLAQERKTHDGAGVDAR